MRYETSERMVRVSSGTLARLPVIERRPARAECNCHPLNWRRAYSGLDPAKRRATDIRDLPWKISTIRRSYPVDEIPGVAREHRRIPFEPDPACNDRRVRRAELAINESLRLDERIADVPGIYVIALCPCRCAKAAGDAGAECQF